MKSSLSSLDNNEIWPSFESEAESLDHSIQIDGKDFAGQHFLVDLWTDNGLDDLNFLETILREMISASEATLLHLHLHHFTPQNGISGVAVLAESHISVHTWPERNFAAFDIFMCGDTKPDLAAKILSSRLKPSRIETNRYFRGPSEP